MRVEYRTLFQEFNGSTQYSVRMKGEDAQGKASTYVSVAFKTPDEQLFTGVEVTANSATLTWEETNRVTHLTLAQMVDTKYGEEKQIDLTSEDIVACSKHSPNWRMERPIVFGFIIMMHYVVRMYSRHWDWVVAKSFCGGYGNRSH